MSQHWALGWPFTMSWAFKYWTEHLKRELPPSIHGHEPYDSTRLLMNSVSEMLRGQPLFGWQYHQCWTPHDDDIVLVLAIYEVRVKSIGELPDTVSLDDDIELTGDQIWYLARALGQGGAPRWYPVEGKDIPDNYAQLVPEVRSTTRAKVDNGESDGTVTGGPSKKERRADGATTPKPTTRR